MRNIPFEIKQPPLDVFLLEHWRGVYDHVFFAFNPLYRVPLPTDVGVEKTHTDGMDWVAATHENRLTDEFDIDNQTKCCAQTLTWYDLHKRVAPESDFKRFAISLWLISVLGFQEDYQELQQIILRYTEHNAWFLPDENQLPPVMEPFVGTFFSQFCQGTITAYSEFREIVGELPIAALAKDQPVNLLKARRGMERINALHAPDPGILMYWSFDDITACICMTGMAHAIAKPEDFFEGLYATPAMKADFLRQL